MPVSFSIADSSDGPRKVVIWVSGDLDADTGRAVRARIAQADLQGRSDVILDLTGVTYVDSVALTSILNGARAMTDRASLRVISPPERVAEVFLRAGLGEVFDLTRDRRRPGDRRKSAVPVPDERRRGERRITPQISETGLRGRVTPPAAPPAAQRPLEGEATPPAARLTPR